jgi:hypothetical protein
VAKLILDNEQVAEEFFEHARLFGIQCPVSPHKFVWLINNHFGYDFRLKTDTDMIVEKRGRKFNFPLYEYVEQFLAVKHFIYSNKSDGKYLLPELKHTDFLWLVMNESNNDGFLELLNQEIRKVNQVQLVTLLNNDKFHNKLQLLQ